MRRNSKKEVLAVLIMAAWTSLQVTLSAAILEDDISVDAPWKEAEKRNTWWSKRSAIQEASEPVLDQDLPLCSSVMTSVGCYVDTCIPLFLECSRSADNKESLSRCKTGHRSCLARCVRRSKSHFTTVQ